MRLQALWAGTGGQRVIWLARVLGEAAARHSVPVLSAETHGMAMRGGSVVCHVKLGPFSSPLVLAGRADLLLSLDAAEAERYRHFLTTLEKSEIQILPLPHIILRQVSISIPDKATGLVRSIDIYPDLWSFIMGDVKFSKISLESPRFTVLLSEDETKKSLEEFEEKIRSVMHVLNSVAPDAVLRIQDGKRDLGRSNRVVFSFDGFQSKLAT